MSGSGDTFVVAKAAAPAHEVEDGISHDNILPPGSKRRRVQPKVYQDPHFAELMLSDIRPEEMEAALKNEDFTDDESGGSSDEATRTAAHSGSDDDGDDLDDFIDDADGSGADSDGDSEYSNDDDAEGDSDCNLPDSDSESESDDDDE